MAKSHPSHEELSASGVPDLVQSFSKLLLNASGDADTYADTLNTLLAMISDEIDRVSNPDSESESKCSGVNLFGSINDSHAEKTDHENLAKHVDEYIPSEELNELKNPDSESESKSSGVDLFGSINNSKVEKTDLENLVNHVHGYIPSEELNELNIEKELEDLYHDKHAKNKYVWLTNSNVPYHFGGKTHVSRSMEEQNGISILMKKINDDHNWHLDSCLVVKYSNSSQALSLHQDDESILDSSHPIVIASLGTPRTIQFWDSNSESSGRLVKEVTPAQGDLVIMEKGCQEHLWHKVLGGSTSNLGVRYAISFRKLRMKMLPNGFPVHPDRAAVTQASTSGQATKSENILSTVLRQPLSTIVPPVDTPRPAARSTFRHIPPKHLIIGDSIAKGVHVAGSSVICKGGIRPNEVLQLLPESTEVIHPSDYDDVRSVTLIVGTNALNVDRPGKGMPFLDVIFDYKTLVYDLRTLFPNARIGLLNVLPRSYKCVETRHRIELFNDLFDQHLAQWLKSVYWIRLYWELVDENGYLRQDLYGKYGLHLKPKGKAMLARCIKSFQHAYS